MRTMSVINHLKLLLWKNYLLQVRHPWVTVIELIVPCLFVAMLAAIRLKVDFTYHSNHTEYERFDTYHIPEIKFGNNLIVPQWVVMYSPNSTRMEKIMKNVIFKLRRYAENGPFDVSVRRKFC
jgi:ATP-binding cassette subfamily A (ABC1) protein 3